MGYGVWPARNASLTSACVAGGGMGCRTRGEHDAPPSLTSSLR
jgi:hypothetical protein